MLILLISGWPLFAAETWNEEDQEDGVDNDVTDESEQASENKARSLFTKPHSVSCIFLLVITMR